jgi:peptide/nickel transport system substrate-binding protein
VANPTYWRTADQPVWEGGPSGAPKIQTAIVRNVPEWGTRFAALQAGDAEHVTPGSIADYPQLDEFVGEECNHVTDECQPTENPDLPLRRWSNLPAVTRTDVFMNFNVATDDAGNNPYIGSGQLDGNGVPPDFFSDIHVRKAFNLCFDYDLFIADAQNGLGVRNNGPIILDMLGYNPSGPMYQFDLDACAAELEQAWGGVLPEVGFRLQATFNTGNIERQTVAAILQTNLAAINPLYQVEIVGLPWPTLLRSFRARQLPLAISGWLEDIHDPHNWVQPYLVGTFAGRQNLPAEMLAKYGELINAGATESDPATRQQIYYDLQQMVYEDAPDIFLSQATSNRYEQRWVQGYFYNPLQTSIGPYFYAYSLAGGASN